jgi:hypothetical protein
LRRRRPWAGSAEKSATLLGGKGARNWSFSGQGVTKLEFRHEGMEEEEEEEEEGG